MHNKNLIILFVILVVTSAVFFFFTRETVEAPSVQNETFDGVARDETSAP
jgi:hypothetical protein